MSEWIAGRQVAFYSERFGFSETKASSSHRAVYMATGEPPPPTADAGLWLLASIVAWGELARRELMHELGRRLRDRPARAQARGTTPNKKRRKR